MDRLAYGGVPGVCQAGLRQSVLARPKSGEPSRETTPSVARAVSRSVAMQDTRQRSLASWVNWAVQVVSPPSPSSVWPWSAVIRSAKPP